MARAKTGGDNSTKAKKPRTKKPKIVPRIPKDDTEANEHLRKIGVHKRIITTAAIELEATIKRLKAEALTKYGPLAQEAEELFEGLFLFAQQNRSTLLKPPAKTVKLPAGEMTWRWTPPKVTIKNVKAVIANIKRLGLESKFLKVKEEVSKAGMLKDKGKAKGIAGVSFTQQELFAVKPNDLTFEITKIFKAATDAQSEDGEDNDNDEG